MKKKLLALFVAVCAAFALFTLAACTDDGNGTGESGDVVTLENGIAFTVKDNVMNITDTTTIKDYMDVLAANGDLSYSGTNQSYGFFLETVNGVTADSANNEYWMIYTDLVTLDGVVYSSDEYGGYEYNGTTLGYASYGMDGMPCVVGYTYVFVLETY